ncbi:MAG: hypothetical protein QXW41_03670 [Fervidicoccaceae archaeon]
MDGGEDHIPLKFFVHNVSLDLAIAVKDIDDKSERQLLVNTVKEQIENARNLLDVFEGKEVKAFEARTLTQWSGIDHKPRTSPSKYFLSSNTYYKN